MAKLVISGHQATLVSNAKLADIQKVATFDPEILTLKNENDEPVFGIAISHCGEGDIGAFGVEFSPKPDLNGFAIASIKLCFPADVEVEEVKKALAESYAGALAKLGGIEDKIPASLTAIDLKIDRAMEKIEVL